MFEPAMFASVLVDPELRRADWMTGEIGHDQRDMAWSRDHWIISVKRALAWMVIAVCVDVCHDTESRLTAACPEWTEASPVKDNDAGIKTARVQVVVVNEPLNNSPPAALVAKKEGATLAATLAASRELSETFVPESG